MAKLAEKAIRVANLHSATLISPYNQIKPTTPEASPTLIRSARVELDRKSARVNSSVTIIGQMVGKATGKLVSYFYLLCIHNYNRSYDILSAISDQMRNKDW